MALPLLESSVGALPSASSQTVPSETTIPTTPIAWKNDSITGAPLCGGGGVALRAVGIGLCLHSHFYDIGIDRRGLEQFGPLCLHSGWLDQGAMGKDQEEGK
jgi:hypothetical protein